MADKAIISVLRTPLSSPSDCKVCNGHLFTIDFDLLSRKHVLSGCWSCGPHPSALVAASFRVTHPNTKLAETPLLTAGQHIG